MIDFKGFGDRQTSKVTFITEKINKGRLQNKKRVKRVTSGKKVGR